MKLILVLISDYVVCFSKVNPFIHTIQQLEFHNSLKDVGNDHPST